MVYEPMPIGRVCRECGQWKPRALLKKNKKQPFGVEQQCLDCCRRHNKQWAEEHREISLLSKTKWRTKHPAEQSRAQKRWVEANPDRIRAISARWTRRHPDKARDKVQRRTARKRALKATLTSDEWAQTLRYWGNACAYCGISSFTEHHPITLHQEHFIPLTKGGSYTWDNILPACKSCNSSKCDSDPQEWLKKRFGEKQASDILKRIQTYFVWVNCQS